MANLHSQVPAIDLDVMTCKHSMEAIEHISACKHDALMSLDVRCWPHDKSSWCLPYARRVKSDKLNCTWFQPSSRRIGMVQIKGFTRV